jgi:3-methyladenine DNA glycosylase/8-oxoguanine DNA glycosylase
VTAAGSRPRRAPRPDGASPAEAQANDALAHLRAADPVLARLLDEQGPPELRRDASRPAPGDHYAALVRSIVG